MSEQSGDVQGPEEPDHSCANCDCGYCDGGPCCQDMGYEMPVLTEENRHEFIGLPRICGRPGCGVHEEGLLVKDSVCKFSPEVFRATHEWPTVVLRDPENLRCLGCHVRWAKAGESPCMYDEEPDCSDSEPVEVDLPPRVQLVVTHLDSTVTYYLVGGEHGGWKIDRPTNCLIIGHGMGRYHIPLCNVRNFSPVEY